MPRVPQREPTGVVQERALPTPQLTAKANADDMGAGYGRGIEAIGKLGMQLWEAEAKKANTVQINRLKRLADEARDKRLYDPAGGFTAKQKLEASESLEGYRNDYRGDLDEIEKEAKNEAQLQMFREYRTQIMPGYDRALMVHANGEVKQYEKQQNSLRLDQLNNSLVQNYHDPIELDRVMKNLELEVREQAFENGLKQEDADRQVEQVKSAGHYNVLQRMLANKENRGAAQYLADHRDEFKGENLVAAEKAVQVGTVREDSQEHADRIMGQGMNQTAAIAAARDIDDAETRDATVTRIKARFSEQKQLDNQWHEEAMVDSFNLLDSTGDIGEIPPETWSRLKGAERRSLVAYHEKMQKGLVINTDWQRDLDLQTMAVDDPQKFADLNLWADRAKYSDSEWKSIVSLQRTVRGALKKTAGGSSSDGSPDGIKYDWIKTKDAMLKQQLSVLEIDPKDTPEKSAQLHEYVQRQYSTYQRNNDGKDPTPAEYQEWLDDASIKVNFQKDWGRDPSMFAFEAQAGLASGELSAKKVYLEGGLDAIPARELAIIESIVGKGASRDEKLQMYFKNNGLPMPPNGNFIQE